MDREHRPIDLGTHEGTPAEEPMIATYTITVECDNCDYEGEAEIPKGTKVADGDCPNCGCQTVVKASWPGPDPAFVGRYKAFAEQQFVLALGDAVHGHLAARLIVLANVEATRQPPACGARRSVRRSC